MIEVVSMAPGRLALDASPHLGFAQKAFIVDRGRLLLVRKSKSDPYHPCLWEVPGGRLKVWADRGLDDHIRREVREEAGIEIEPGEPFHLWEWTLPPVSEGRTDPEHPVRIVAVARYCRPVTTTVSVGNQTSSDHLSGAEWVRFDMLEQYSFIPDLKPVMESFMSRYGSHPSSPSR